MNISSYIILLHENYRKDVTQFLGNINECEIQHEIPGKIIITLETAKSGPQIEIIRSIETLQGVSSVTLAYSYYGEDLELARESVENSITIPDWLNSNTARAEEIPYNGDIRSKKAKR